MCVESAKFRDVSPFYNKTTACQVNMNRSHDKANLFLSSEQAAKSCMVGEYAKCCLYSLKIDTVQLV